jgi:putative transposase
MISESLLFSIPYYPSVLRDPVLTHLPLPKMILGHKTCVFTKVLPFYIMESLPRIMNTRDYKIFRPGESYHIFNRGNNKESILEDDRDAISFLNRLRIILALDSAISLGIRSNLKPLPKDAFTVIAYCLMPNHYHLQIKQNSDVPISVLIKNLSTSYSKYFNIRHKRVGNLFQDIFKAKLIDSDAYHLYLTAYIHNNPPEPSSYPYSSLREYLTPYNVKNISNPNLILRSFDDNPLAYSEFVEKFQYQEYKKIQHLTFED